MAVENERTVTGMDEYIEREAAYKTIMSDPPDAHYPKWYADKILAIPAADVAPVRHGRWDNIPNTYMCVAGKDGSYHGNATSCSVCNEINPNAYKTNYCPNCGAKMMEG